MSINTQKFAYTSLDFDSIRQSLRDYLGSQTEFTDYDFEGSGLSVILNTLSLNAQHLAFYTNMVANEMFLDSADMRESVVSRAKELGYTPRSRNAAQAIVNLLITPPLLPAPPSKITIDAYTPFTTSLDNVSYSFVTTQAFSLDLDPITLKYSASNVVLTEGRQYTFRYIVDSSIPHQRFIIPSANVDMNTVRVRVQNNTVNPLTTLFLPALEYNLLTPTDSVYFTQEIEDQRYEIYFGDGILGQQINDGNVVLIDYIVCSADASNQANTFVAASAVGGFSSVLVTTVTPAYGGAEREDIDSIKFSAPKTYQAQNRAVTASDYRTILLNEYPNTDSLSVWGGENNDPPIYGKVFISIKPKVGFVITQNTKQNIIETILATRNMLTIIPEIIDPEYLFVEVVSLVKFDANATTLTSDALKTNVLSSIANFNMLNINKFERAFRYSTLSRVIDTTESSITNNLTSIRLQKRFTPVLNIGQSLTFKFEQSIVPGSLLSTQFICTSDPSFKYVPNDVYRLDDDGNGFVRLFKFVATDKVIVKPKAGTIDYVNGIVVVGTPTVSASITPFIPSSVLDVSGQLKLSVIPTMYDVTPQRNTIITIDMADVTVNMQVNASII